MDAVLTGDIVNSTSLDTRAENKLRKRLEEVFQPNMFEFYRGDSFQVHLPDSERALKTALICRTAAIGLMPDQAVEQPVVDVRISIGIGSVINPVKSISTAKGEAFLLSGRAFDQMDKSAERLVIVSGDKLTNIALAVIADYINSIFKQLTTKQAEVMYRLLLGDTQQQVAERLNRSKSTISQHVTAGRWEEIDRILHKFHELNELITV